MLRCFILPFFALAAAALGQEPEEAEIVVTGRGLSEGRGERVYDSVEIDRDRLTGSASGRLDEVLKDVPGFQLFRRSDARSANPTSQGVTLRALGGNASSRALLLLDGVPQTDPFGGWISWPAYDPERLGAVRIVRGGGSGANGPGALAGTIELISASPAQLSGVTGGIAYGSRDSLDARASGGAPLGSGFVTLSGRYGRGEGFIPLIEAQRGPVDRASPYEQASMALRAVVPVGGGVEVQASGLLFSDDRERGTQFSEIGTTGSDASVRVVGPRWSALAYVQRRDFTNSFASVNEARTSVSQVSEQFAVPSTGLGARFEVRPIVGPLELRLGSDWRNTEGETRERYNFQNGAATRARVAGGQSSTVGSFAEAAWENSRVTVTGGARIDRWRIENGGLNERLLSGGQLTDIRYSDRAGWEPTGRAGLAWRAGPTLTLRTAAYLGWRLPTLNELYRPFRVGPDATAANPELAPERLRGIEGGVAYRPSPAARIGVTIFSNRLTDGIANVTLARGPGVFPGVGFVAAGGEYGQRRNLDAVVSRGVEVDGRLEAGRWSLSGGFSFAHSTVRASGPALPLTGLRPAQTPRHSFAATLGWTAVNGARASLSGRYTGAQFEDDLNQQILPGALTFDAFSSIPLSKAISLEARAENITDKEVVAGISGSGLVERATPRTFWIGARLRH